LVQIESSFVQIESAFVQIESAFVQIEAERLTSGSKTAGLVTEEPPGRPGNGSRGAFGAQSRMRTIRDDARAAGFRMDCSQMWRSRTTSEVLVKDLG